MSREEIEQKANDIVGFMAGFNIDRLDAAQVAIRAYNICQRMGDNEFHDSGKDIAAMLGITNEQNVN